jgi:hypothetical protein
VVAQPLRQPHQQDLVWKGIIRRHQVHGHPLLDGTHQGIDLRPILAAEIPQQRFAAPRVITQPPAVLGHDLGQLLARQVVHGCDFSLYFIDIRAKGLERRLPGGQGNPIGPIGVEDHAWDVVGTAFEHPQELVESVPLSSPPRQHNTPKSIPVMRRSRNDLWWI